MKENGLVLSKEIQRTFPTITEGLQKAQRIFDSINSFEDIEREFLLGAGLSPSTYQTYLKHIKYFYEFTDGLNPLQVKPAHLEEFYDSMIKRGLDRNTAALRMKGIKRFFAGIRNVIPFYTSPFEIMNEKLKVKISRTKKGNRTKAALNKGEIKSILSWLQKDKSLLGLENYAIFFILLTSGLRAGELLQLRWKDLQYDPDNKTWVAQFIGKGQKEAEQELYPEAVGSCRKYFRAAFKRDPGPDDRLFWTVPSFNGDKMRPLPYPTLWSRFKELGKKIMEEGIIKRNIAISPHLLRRSYATALYKAGMKLKAIQEKTRHASMDTLTRHYIKDEEPAAPYFEKILA